MATKQRKPRRKIQRRSKPKAIGNGLAHNLLSVESVELSTYGMRAMNFIIVSIATGVYAYIINTGSLARLTLISGIIFYTLTSIFPIIGMTQIFMFWRFHARSRKGPYIKDSDAEYLRKIARWEVINSIIALTVLSLFLLYFSGFTDKTAAFISLRFPNLAGRASDIISYIITIVISGVIGNFAYDLLKRLITKLFTKRHMQDKK